MLWQENWGVAGGAEYMYGCRPTSDGGYIITGWTSYYGGWDDQLFALKLGESSGLEEGAIPNSILSVSPNPCRSGTTIHLENTSQLRSTLKAYNSLGYCIHTFFENAEIIGITDVEWETDQLVPGIYFIRMETFSGNYIVKVVKVD
jgi:hypothetical protein